MSSLKTLQSGTATIGINSFTTDISITAVTLGKAWVEIQCTYSTSETQVPDGVVSAQITTTTNVHCERGILGNMSITIFWQVIEIEGATVQRGNLTPYFSGDAYINTVNWSKTFAITTVRGTSISTFGHAWGKTEPSGSNNYVTLQGDAGLEYPTHEWQVISIDDITVAKYGFYNISNASYDITITSVTTTQSLLFLSARPMSGVTQNPAKNPTARFTSSTNVRIERSASSSIDGSVFVVSCPLWDVQHSYNTLSSNSNDITISSVDTSKTISSTKGLINTSYACTASTTFDWGNFSCKAILTSSTNCQVTRGASSGNFYIPLQIWRYSGLIMFLGMKAFEYDFERGLKTGFST